jgi:hypothetical protein
MKSLADEYVKEGMPRFVDGQYSRHMYHGGMIGYVLDVDVTRAMANVLRNIRDNHTALGIVASGAWSDSPHRPADPHAKESANTGAGTGTGLLIQHLFVAAGCPIKGGSG